MFGFATRRCRLRRLRLGIISILALTVFAATRAVPSQSSSSSDNDKRERLETVWNEAHERGDADALNALWADDLEVAVPKMPVMSKTDVMKFARSGRMKFLHYRTSDISRSRL